MAFSVQIVGLDRMLKRFDRYAVAAKKAVFRGVERTGFEVQDEGRKNAPFDTTTLINSIQITERNPEALSVTVQTTQPSRDYAAYQNWGFFGEMRVRPYERLQWHVFGRRLTTPITVTIPAHSRFYAYAGYGYMNTARLKGDTRIAGNIQAELEAVQL